MTARKIVDCLDALENIAESLTGLNRADDIEGYDAEVADMKEALTLLRAELKASAQAARS